MTTGASDVLEEDSELVQHVPTNAAAGARWKEALSAQRARRDAEHVGRGVLVAEATYGKASIKNAIKKRDGCRGSFDCAPPGKSVE